MKEEPERAAVDTPSDRRTVSDFFQIARLGYDAFILQEDLPRPEMSFRCPTCGGQTCDPRAIASVTGELAAHPDLRIPTTDDLIWGTALPIVLFHNKHRQLVQSLGGLCGIELTARLAAQYLTEGLPLADLSEFSAYVARPVALLGQSSVEWSRRCPSCGGSVLGVSGVEVVLDSPDVPWVTDAYTDEVDSVARVTGRYAVDRDPLRGLFVSASDVGDDAFFSISSLDCVGLFVTDQGRSALERIGFHGVRFAAMGEVTGGPSAIDGRLPPVAERDPWDEEGAPVGDVDPGSVLPITRADPVDTPPGSAAAWTTEVLAYLEMELARPAESSALTFHGSFRTDETVVMVWRYEDPSDDVYTSVARNPEGGIHMSMRDAEGLEPAEYAGTHASTLHNHDYRA